MASGAGAGIRRLGLRALHWRAGRGGWSGRGRAVRSRIAAAPRSELWMASGAGAAIRRLGLRAVDWRAGRGGWSGRGRAVRSWIAAAPRSDWVLAGVSARYSSVTRVGVTTTPFDRPVAPKVSIRVA
jgi:hypothetical protein